MGLPFMSFTNDELKRSELIDISNSTRNFMDEVHGNYWLFRLKAPNQHVAVTALPGGAVEWYKLEERGGCCFKRIVPFDEILVSITEDVATEMLYNLNLYNRDFKYFKEKFPEFGFG